MTPTPSSPEDWITRLDESAAWIRSRFPGPLALGVVLGSGLGAFGDHLAGTVRIPYQEIPHFPVSRTKGHAGTLVLGEVSPGFAVGCLQGRFHAYEGHDPSEVVFPVRVLQRLGAGRLIVTNAAGGIHPDFQPGDLMLITDHLNLMGENPLRGPNLEDLGPRFPDLSEAYSRPLRALAESSARSLGIPLVTGVYAAVSGPSYETPAEIRMLKTLGADAVGMSTVPEVIAANHLGMKVLGLSCIANRAAGLSDHPLSHAEVLEAGRRVESRFTALLDTVVKALAANPAGKPAC